MSYRATAKLVACAAAYVSFVGGSYYLFRDLSSCLHRRDRLRTIHFQPAKGRIVSRHLEESNMFSSLSNEYDDFYFDVDDASSTSSLDNHNRMNSRNDHDAEWAHYAGSVAYEYNVGGRMIVGKDIWLHVSRLDILLKDASPVSKMVIEAHVGDLVPVFYDPQNPTVAVLEKGPHPADVSWTIHTASVALPFLGASLFWLSKRL
eukprot:ANDGO_03597.mRNA.1 hypothetical protein